MSKPDVSPRDSRYRGFVNKPTVEWARRIRALYKLVDMPDDAIAQAFSGEILAAHDLGVAENGIPASGERPGDALYCACFDFWVDGIPTDSAPDASLFWGVRQTLKNHDMIDTLEALEGRLDLPWDADEDPRGGAREPGARPSLNAFLHHLMTLQCDAEKRAMILDDGEYLLYLVVVDARDAGRVCRDVHKLFGDRWSVWDDGSGSAPTPGGEKPVGEVGSSSGPRREAGADDVATDAAAARQREADERVKERRLSRGARLQRVRIIVAFILVALALVMQFIIIPAQRREAEESRRRADEQQEYIDSLTRYSYGAPDLPETLSFPAPSSSAGE